MVDVRRSATTAALSCAGSGTHGHSFPANAARMGGYDVSMPVFSPTVALVTLMPASELDASGEAARPGRISASLSKILKPARAMLHGLTGIASGAH